MRRLLLVPAVLLSTLALPACGGKKPNAGGVVGVWVLDREALLAEAERVGAAQLAQAMAEAKPADRERMKALVPPPEEVKAVLSKLLETMDARFEARADGTCTWEFRRGGGVEAGTGRHVLRGAVVAVTPDVRGAGDAAGSEPAPFELTHAGGRLTLAGAAEQPDVILKRR
jgi:hypothetical protein